MVGPFARVPLEHDGVRTAPVPLRVVPVAVPVVLLAGAGGGGVFAAGSAGSARSAGS